LWKSASFLLCNPPMKAAVFFERDGILNRVRVERQNQVSPRTLDDFVLNEEAIEPMRALKKAGLFLVATTNQPGLSRGYLSRRELDLMHSVLHKRFPLDDLLMCPHDELDRCPCRKPKPGLFLEAGFKWHLDLEHSFVISDKWQDAEAAHNAGCTSLLIKSPWNGSGHRDFIFADLQTALERILQLHTSGVCTAGAA
jgi:D-glycero-D-manno-heptose 1,7-bisphosphate phosphatase